MTGKYILRLKLNEKKGLLGRKWNERNTLSIIDKNIKDNILKYLSYRQNLNQVKKPDQTYKSNQLS